jgi:glycosyltransferase involved in cell wall biosynthesis
MKTISLSANSSWYLYNFRSSTINHALQKGYSVICISPEDSYSQELIKLGCSHYPLSFKSKSVNPFLELMIFVKFFIAYFRIKPKVAFHFTIKNNIYGTFAASILGIPAVNNISGLGTAFLKKNIFSSFVLFLYKISQGLAFKIFCQNKEDYNFLIQNKVTNKNKLILIPGSGVDTQKFHPSKREQYKYLKSKKLFTFLYIGRMLYDKGLNELLEAIKIINLNEVKCKLVLCGFTDSDNVSAVSLADLNKWSNFPGVDWIGSTNSVEIIMAKVDCVVLASYREGMPRSLLEAGSMGLPSIATDVPGCRNIISNEFNGFLCKSNSSRALVEVMEKVLSLTSDELEKIGSNARKNVLNNFDEKIVINKFFEVLNLL